MPDPNFVIFYVDSPAASAAFYANLLGKPAVEASPTFAMFALESGVMRPPTMPLRNTHAPPVFSSTRPHRGPG